ncbi:DUF4440 domain-containing protein [Gordonia pseudamarae]|uniref:DUF4440 domain-containing protein n=1 Tax=Gordonia pseudamarae TaxID=2831662 RepID=A0ABX6ING7_9ACTN|nr:MULTISPECIES: nuclear transport factor 2 family protein [Gordonia]MBD0021877.1 nuclear transport factor 2 family protein [Gordonia sp. (in: high G+C Gram-positive bacteria)]QHN27987.1 DUF4440 domain-containing protein [Gordonia pseudamarae]QHN36845.1 DUF4440 domain-containing protein [Gordonia pseudamarae]
MQTEIEAIRSLKAQYCRFLDTRDGDAWRALFADDVVVRVDMAPGTNGADPQTAPPVEGADVFVSFTLSALNDVATVHHVHTPEIALTADDTATGIWAMEDWLVYPDGGELRGAGHYHETYRKSDGRWQITSLHLTRTVVQVSRPTS